LAAQDKQGLNDFDDPDASRKSFLTNKVVDPLHTFNNAGQPLPSNFTGPLVVPRWQTSPVLETSMVNQNLLESRGVANIITRCIESREAILGGFHFAPAGSTSDNDPTTAFFATLASMAAGQKVDHLGDPMSHIAFPIFDSLNDTDRGEVVGIVKATIHWLGYLRGVLPVTDYGYQVVIESGCGTDEENTFTYQVDGPVSKVVGLGDRHDRGFSQYVVDGYFSKDTIKDGTAEGIPFYLNSCPYVFHVYPTQREYDKYVTTFPVVISISIAAIFFFAICMFVFYDWLVERRQKIVLAKATQSAAIVSSLFVSDHES
jgi:hypothetical protein